jgi:hypothetical protein
VSVDRERATTSPLRVALVLAGLGLLALAVAFIDQPAWVGDVWPWKATPLSFIFLASIFVAIAMPAIWIGVSGELAAMRAGALDLAVTYVCMLVYVITLLGNPGQPELGVCVAFLAVAFAATALVFVWSRRIDWQDQRGMPGPVRVSFAAFAVVLTAVAIGLIFHAKIFPWPLGPETSVMFGFIYLGAAAYFAYGVLDPRWSNAAGQLVGFLAYDIVLIAPFIGHFDEVSGVKLTSLMVYTAFVVYSGAVAVYYLFIHPETRVRIS